MEKIEDIGIILKSVKHDQNAYLVSIFSAKHGLIKGFIKIAKEREHYLLPCNVINFEWSARVISQLGKLKIDVAKSYGSMFLASRRQIYIMGMLLPMLCDVLQEHIAYESLFEDIIRFFSVYNEDDIEVLSSYILLEFAILKDLGFGINFERCNVSGADSVQYISPQTGNAVSADVAVGFESKLFKIPQFVLDGLRPQNIDEIASGEQITRFFLKKFLCENLPYSRENFANYLKNLR